MPRRPRSPSDPHLPAGPAVPENTGRTDLPVPRTIMASAAALPQTPPKRLRGCPTRSMRCLVRSGRARDVNRLERQHLHPSVASRARLESLPGPYLLTLPESSLRCPCACLAPLDH